MQKTDSAKVPNSETLDSAIKNIFESYGSNLSAFFRDAREQSSDETAPASGDRRVQNDICQTKRSHKLKSER